MKKPNQLPSEAVILDFIKTSASPAGKRDIAQAFKLKGAAKIALKQMLKDMERRGVLNRKRKTLTGNGQMPPVATLEVVGFDEHGELYGEPEDWDGSVLPRIIIRSPLAQSEHAQPPKPGDRIVARLEELPGDETYTHAAIPMRTLPGQGVRILGILKSAKGEPRLIPIDKKSKRDLDVVKSSIGEAQDGELVAAELVRDRRRGYPLARIKSRFGDVSDPRNISLLAIHQHGVPNAFPQRVMDDTAGLTPFAQAGRDDFRAIPLITIDPADARDHDDAVHAQPDDNPANEGGHIVIVAIADVAAYVRPQTALDREARMRGNSTYFPDRVVPMLPERISNDLCSLKQGEVRPAIAVRLVFNQNGTKLRHSFHRVVMRSAAKLSYEEAQAAIDGRPSDVSKALRDEVLRPLWNAYRSLLKARAITSPLELDLPERRIKLDAEGKVSGVHVPPRLDAHRLIEEFMIQANVAAAEELEKRKMPLLYRIHDQPSKEKIRALAAFLKTVGLNFPLGQVLATRQFNALLAKAENSEFERAIHDVVLRTQAQARYSPENIGHFGLSLKRYAHFTSPIRRYADLIVHRALIAAIDFGEDGLSPDDRKTLAVTAEMISAAERRSALAERDTIDRLVAAYLSEHTGSIFSGRISGVVGAGLFVKLDATGADGFVPVGTLGHHYYIYDEARHALTSSVGETFQLGDAVQVRLVEAVPIKGGLRFSMESQGKKGPVPRRSSR